MINSRYENKKILAFFDVGCCERCDCSPFFSTTCSLCFDNVLAFYRSVLGLGIRSIPKQGALATRRRWCESAIARRLERGAFALRATASKRESLGSYRVIELI